MKRYGLIGKSLGHSFSKGFFEKFFDDNNIDASYENFEIESIEEIESLLKNGVAGYNVTIPYKETVIPFLDELDPIASSIGAVNVIEIKNGKTKGFNSDAYGFHQSIKPFLTNKHERAVVFGSGGASKAVVYALKSIGVNPIVISRSPSQGQFSYNDVNENMIKACKLVVNTTPIGTFPKVEECLSLPFQSMTEDHLVVDLIYNPEKTEFLKRSEEFGATVMNGYSMLKLQAMKAWEIWNEVNE